MGIIGDLNFNVNTLDQEYKNSFQIVFNLYIITVDILSFSLKKYLYYM